MKPLSFRVIDNGEDVEKIYNAEYWWLDMEGKVWIKQKETNLIYEVVGDNVEIKLMERID